MSDSIRFILNGEEREVKDLPATMTVLQYLRTQEHLTGTKEGCAEGDCGACTVILGEPADGKVSYKSVNACIVFLPVLDGKHVVTVEYLKRAAGGPHPVQKAMVECHASQCGFCTPGFVMSLAALHHNNLKASDDDIQDAVAGNLCRCTGYRPILAAARKANEDRSHALPSDAHDLKDLRREKMFVYNGGGQKFLAPVTMDEAANAVARYPDATLLAGGTDVGLWVTKMHMKLPVIIYTGNVKELREIGQTDAGLEIGAAVTYSEAFRALADYDESLKILLKRFGSLQIRNLGTIGGNIANGSPIGDGMPPLIALGAKLVLRSKDGRRTIPLEDYFLGYKKQDRKRGEFVEMAVVPPLPDHLLFRTYKVSKRFDEDISAVCGAFALRIEKKKIVEARLAYGGMAATPKRAAGTEKALIGQEWNEETVRKAMAEVDRGFAPLTDMRASDHYRREVAANLLYRFWLETTQPEIETRVYEYR